MGHIKVTAIMFLLVAFGSTSDLEEATKEWRRIDVMWRETRPDRMAIHRDVTPQVLVEIEKLCNATTLLKCHINTITEANIHNTMINTECEKDIQRQQREWEKGVDSALACKKEKEKEKKEEKGWYITVFGEKKKLQWFIPLQCEPKDIRIFYPTYYTTKEVENIRVPGGSAWCEGTYKQICKPHFWCKDEIQTSKMDAHAHFINLIKNKT